MACFGNICLGEGNGRALGFWSNENGQALITPAMLAGLNNLPLENATIEIRTLQARQISGICCFAEQRPPIWGATLDPAWQRVSEEVNAPTGKGRPNAVDPNAYINALAPKFSLSADSQRSSRS